MGGWSPEKYLQFADERTRAARDLLSHVPLRDPATVFDLGCGPGNSTELLHHAFPAAALSGVDASPEMLAKARKTLPQVSFVAADVRDWRPPAPADLLFANALFQWLPDHLPLLLALIGHLTPGGVLAVQMPDNLDEPSHALMRATAGDGPWAHELREAASARAVLAPPQTYYAALKPLCRRVDVWRTDYYHPLQGADGIIAWLASTGLKPFLDPLPQAQREAFLAAYRVRLLKAYPAQADGTVLLRFPRLFVVAER